MQEDVKTSFQYQNVLFPIPKDFNVHPVDSLPRGCVALEFFTSTLFTLDLKKRLRAKKMPQCCE